MPGSNILTAFFQVYISVNINGQKYDIVIQKRAWMDTMKSAAMRCTVTSQGRVQYKHCQWKYVIKDNFLVLNRGLD